MTWSIRDPRDGDQAEWLRLWQGYLDFYSTALAPEVTRATWDRILDPESRLSCRVASRGGALGGFAVWHHHVASWSLQDDCYLEDLYVDPGLRGAGLGRALIDDLIGVARDRRFGRIYWHTNATNSRARALYDRYAPADGHIRYRFRL
jgi:GNAT superfamily N-acetyltransferase